MVRTDSHSRRSFCETAGMTGWRQRPEHVLGPSFQHPWPRMAASSGEAARTVEGLIAATPWHPGPCWGHLPGACSPRDPNSSAGPDAPLPTFASFASKDRRAREAVRSSHLGTLGPAALGPPRPANPEPGPRTSRACVTGPRPWEASGGGSPPHRARICWEANP